MRLPVGLRKVSGFRKEWKLEKQYYLAPLLMLP